MSRDRSCITPRCALSPVALESPPPLRGRAREGGRPSHCSPSVSGARDDMREFLISMERRRRRQGPFERGGARAPGIGGGLLAPAEGIDDDADEEERRAIGQESADRG